MRRSEGPRKVRDGIKLDRRRKEAARTWVARRWLDLVEGRLDADEMAAGLEYARTGQTRTMLITPGRIEASVQGSAPKPYEVGIVLPVVDEGVWTRIIQAMVGEAKHAAALLAGEVAESLDDLMRREGGHLLAPSGEAIRFTCTCGGRDPCKHAAAVAYLIADRLSRTPTLAFDLSGQSAEQVLNRLRQARAMSTRGVAAAHADPFGADRHDVPPLETCLDDFWGNAQQITELGKPPPSEHAPLALLRRLGPSPIDGRFPLVGLLASIYETVSKDALRIRDEAERLE
jgi:uncharacterized Zn finger protein